MGRLQVAWALVALAALAATPASAAGEDDWMECAKSCKCKWVSGKKTAECTNASLTTVPSGLSSQIQSLSLSGNSISELTKDAFYSVNLTNLHKLYLQDCRIQKLNGAAFRGLEILIELDLSNNEISKLHPGTFKDTGKLRVLNLQKNSIHRLEDNLFTNLIFLQSIDLSNCLLTHIGHKTFHNVTKLQTLQLGNNKLMHIRPESFMPLVKLSYLVLRNNPWHCDCQLKDFYDWMTGQNLTIDTQCVEPATLKGRPFNDLKSRDFECNFKIVYPPVGKELHVDSGNITLGCKVVGYPHPNIHWVFNSRNVESIGDHHFVISRGLEWTNLTILDVQPADEGEYTCVANGSGLMEERKLMLYIQGSTVLGGSIAGMNDTLWLIIGLVIGVIILLIVVLLMFCCFCRRPQPESDKKSMQSDGLHGSANGDAGLDPEQAKSLLVNPVQKPPRRAEMQPLVTNANNTQIHAGKSPYLDNGSVFLNGSCSDDNHLDQSTDSMDSQRDDVEPPDLLSFRSRGSQGSPAGSTASTAPDSHRLPQPGLQSPVHHYAQSLCGTLPYSRSHSPFAAAVPRQGYVTIPRRPRVPSWASMPASSPVCGPGDVVGMFKLEPVYDNLGPRTTADGSSVLSLNKADDLATPMRGRPLPSTPNYHNVGLPVHYAPIEETELQPSPLVKRPANRSTPNIEASSGPRGNRSGSSPNPNRTSPEGGLPPRVDESKAKANPAALVNGHSKSQSSIKVPPKPPPKPKKKSDAVSPLFEDEGEDGTEV